jgi:hypothetical protein
MAIEFTNPEHGVLSITDEGLAELNPRSDATERDFRFLGVVISLALSSRVVFPVTFVPSFYKLLLNHSIGFDDLGKVDSQTHQNLVHMRFVYIPNRL